MAAEDIKQQSSADLQLTATAGLSRIPLHHQATYLGDAAKAPAAELGKIEGLLQLFLQRCGAQQLLLMHRKQLRQGIGARSEQFKTVVIHRHGEGAAVVTRQAPGPEEAEPFMHKPALQGVGIEVIAITRAA